MKKYIFLCLIIISLIGIIVFLQNAFAPRDIEDNKIRVMTSFYPLFFLSEQIAGSRMEITNITPAGIEPHDYEPTPKEMALMEKSRLIILNGIGLEPWAKNMEKNINPAKTKILWTGENLTDKNIKEDSSGTADPHVWLSPILLQQMAEKILLALKEVDPSNADYYSLNANNLKAKLEKLDSDYREGLKNCAKRLFISSHTAFSYLATDYNLEQIALTGLSPEAEPPAQQIAQISALAKKSGVDYIFFETLTSPKLSETLAKEVGAQTLVLNPLEGLTEEEFKAGENYLSIMEKNLQSLKTALQCK